MRRLLPDRVRPSQGIQEPLQNANLCVLSGAQLPKPHTTQKGQSQQPFENFYRKKKEPAPQNRQKVYRLKACNVGDREQIVSYFICLLAYWFIGLFKLSVLLSILV